MSQSILIIGTYRNNKTYGRGTHNPKNNRNFDVKEIGFLNEGIQDIKSKLNKFKKLEIIGDVEGKEKVREEIKDINSFDFKNVINVLKQV